MDALQQERIAENESRFRQANELIREAIETFDGGVPRSLSLMCECGLGECQNTVKVGAEAYATARSNPRYFLVLPDHVIEPAERVVERQATYWIVEKTGWGGVVAEGLA